MGGLISIIIVLVGATYYFSMRLSGNKKAAEEDDVAGGAAWFVVFLGCVFFSIFLISLFQPYLKILDQPLKTIVQIIIGAIFIYLPYKIACLVAPAKDQNKEK